MVRTASKESSGGLTATERIDAWIAELDDWCGARLAEFRELIHDAEPTSPKSGTGADLPSGRTTACSLSATYSSAT